MKDDMVCKILHFQCIKAKILKTILAYMQISLFISVKIYQ